MITMGLMQEHFIPKLSEQVTLKLMNGVYYYSCQHCATITERRAVQ